MTDEFHYVAWNTREDLIDGEIEIIQRGKSLTEEGVIMPGTALHKIEVNDRDRKLLAKCSFVSTDWAIELESPFFSGRHVLVRKMTPGTTLSHKYDNQGAFDRAVIRAHLLARSGDTVFDGYLCRSQKVSNPLERTHDLKKLEARRCSRKHFKSLSKAEAHAIPAGIKQRSARGDVPETNEFWPQNSSPNSTEETLSHIHTRCFPTGRVPDQLSAFSDNERIQMGREKFSEASVPRGSSAPNSFKTTVGPTGTTDKKPPKVDLPDPKNVPKAVLEVRNYGDVLANKKVIDYLNRLEDGVSIGIAHRQPTTAAMIYRHVENGVKVSEEDIKSLSSATSAILREYGYDFSESPRITNPYRHRAKKTRSSPEETESSSVESDVSDGELKSEVVKRAIEGRDFTELMGLLNNSEEWKAADAKAGSTSGSNGSGKIERKIQDLS